MAQLAVNVDHVATLRQARGVDYPDPAAAAVLVELAGADGVVIHLREDRRHINERDARVIRQLVRTKLILEMAPSRAMLEMAKEIAPHQATLVPETREEITTEGGLDLLANRDTVAGAIEFLHAAGIKASLFVDPEPEQMRAAAELSADVVELHTGAFCEARGEDQAKTEMARIARAAREAHSLGLTVHAGHGIGYTDIRDFSGIPEIAEFSIGHSIVSRAVLVGMDRAVREMLALVRGL
ncbi:MAG: pyridoxine 5'-phosphate synthase [Proteobacteria bacterium]|nr:pyridoxine 5'-phosphate synthase [Pseudomonadota bacterium]